VHTGRGSGSGSAGAASAAGQSLWDAYVPSDGPFGPEGRGVDEAEEGPGGALSNAAALVHPLRRVPARGGPVGEGARESDGRRRRLGWGAGSWRRRGRGPGGSMGAAAPGLRSCDAPRPWRAGAPPRAAFASQRSVLLRPAGGVLRARGARGAWGRGRARRRLRRRGPGESGGGGSIDD